MNLSENGSNAQQSQYQGLIDSLRRASAGTTGPYRGSTYLSQYPDQGLIRLTLTRLSNSDEVSLWIDPVNLYVLGFTNRSNQTWQFNDNRFSLANRLSTSGFQPNGAVQTLPFGGNYLSLTASAGVNRGNFLHNYGDVIGSVSQLATVTNPTGGQANGSNQQWTARSLLLLIQMTSESARLYDINGVFRTTMIGTNASPGITAYQSNLENGWGQASGYGQNVTNNPAVPGITTTGGVTWNSWADIAARIAILLYRTGIVPDGGSSSNWSHDEL
ncbi:ribosome-inactivating family protein [Streptomyces sp. NPDC001414]